MAAREAPVWPCDDPHALPVQVSPTALPPQPTSEARSTCLLSIIWSSTPLPFSHPSRRWMGWNRDEMTRREEVTRRRFGLLISGGIGTEWSGRDEAGLGQAWDASLEARLRCTRPPTGSRIAGLLLRLQKRPALQLERSLPGAALHVQAHVQARMAPTMAVHCCLTKSSGLVPG
jgi:hypothetical protein